MAWTDAAAGEILNDVLGYPNWHGVANGPSLVNWLPDMTIGSYTGQYQAGWNVAGNNDYVVYGGEFPTVNGVGQQGLVRFARRGLAPQQGGPAVHRWHLRAAARPDLVLDRAGQLARRLRPRRLHLDLPGDPQRSHRHAALHDDGELELVDAARARVRRHRPDPGATYTYQLVANDPYGNTVYGASASITMPASSSPSNGYAQSVRANGARIYWPMNETSGLTINDRAAGTGATQRHRRHRRPWRHGRQLEPVRRHRRRHGGGADRQRLEPGLRARVRDRPRHLHHPGVGAHHDATAAGGILGLRRPPERQLGAPRPAHLHGQRRSHRLRRPRAEQPAPHRDEPVGLQQQPVAHGHRDDELAPACGSTSTAPSSARAPTPPRARPTSATGGSAATPCPAGRAQPSHPNFVGGVDEVAVYPTALAPGHDPGAVRAAQRRGWRQPAAVGLLHLGRHGSHGLVQRLRARATPTGRSPATRGTSVTAPPAPASAPATRMPRPGTYTAQLTVTDNQGATGTHDPSGHRRSRPGVIANDALQPHRRRRLGPGRHRWPVDPDHGREQLLGLGRSGHDPARRVVGTLGLPQRRPRPATSTCGRRSASTSRRPVAASTPRPWSGGSGTSDYRAEGAGHRHRHHGLPGSHGRRGRDDPHDRAAARGRGGRR